MKKTHLTIASTSPCLTEARAIDEKLLIGLVSSPGHELLTYVLRVADTLRGLESGHSDLPPGFDWRSSSRPVAG
ncbi:hypothetical protein GOL74_25475 [Sinorhizobium medicae]|nr:hypothetical protein [Sinorhizobium medicae]